MPTLHCKRCGHKWIPRGNSKPKRCPDCNSPYWDKFYQRKVFTVSVPISRETKEKLDSFKKDNETYDDAIKRILGD